MDTITITPVTGTLGAVVEGIDVRTVTDEVVADLRQALLTHQVLFLRDQELTDEEQLTFAGRFGKPSVFPLGALFGSTAPSVSVIRDSADSPPDADGWHTDVTWIQEPPAMAFLNALQIPPAGGDTMWVDLYALYDRLSPTMRRVCDGLTAHHWFGEAFAAAVGRHAPDVVDLLRDKHPYPGVSHPLVRVHPETGRKALFLSGFLHQIDGMHPDESAALLGFLNKSLDDPNVQCRWRWRANDLAIWDERCTNHRALSDHYPADRAMRRCTIDGDRPTGPGVL